MKVAVIMGSISDREIAKKVKNKLDELEIENSVNVISAHRSLDLLMDFCKKVEEEEIGVIIAIAGMSAHLAGVTAALVDIPVIGIPVKSKALEGLDALLSTVQMPKGVPVATVAIDGGENAAILAGKILALNNKKIMNNIKQLREKSRADIIEINKDLEI
ncbi:5-(carboxyamino)imidazole ribonucleotide mutase [Miniphocaeibacter halophilus]|uniref:5-(Carboxyamino)imidazole ribonucleotide mutase n=1 Tax=Miniphocaeibacter halophilus TaxID=2931922 RepID=A0AC61MT47_9FIRM|nr:5-(carboxyamino)imidazole ribonucleotide mutase [Miniphocaeibacter halophilus]QQK07994.1 5-(carboxyamino)imidazole ribonucleotide mutase [Miniphocaeibacter halophilus]